MAETIAKQKSVQRGRQTPRSKNGSGGRSVTSRSQPPRGSATDILALSAAILVAPRLEALALKDSLAVRNIISEAIAIAKLLLRENLSGSAIDIEEDGLLGRRQAERTLESRSSTRERRKYTRYSCIGQVEFRALDSDVSMSGQLIDLGLGGCYVKIPPPFLAGTLLDVVLRVKQVRVRIEGQVAAVQPRTGMRIEFTRVVDETSKRLPQLIKAIRC